MQVQLILVVTPRLAFVEPEYVLLVRPLPSNCPYVFTCFQICQLAIRTIVDTHKWGSLLFSVIVYYYYFFFVLRCRVIMRKQIASEP